MNKDVKKTVRLKDSFWSPVTFHEEVINEATGETRMAVQGIVQEADSVNLNHRLYPKAVIQEALDNITPKCIDRRVFGEVDHPDFRGSLKDTSHLVTKLWWNEANDKQLMGEMLVLNTPTGLILKEILRAEGKPGFSSRGRGHADEVEVDGYGKVEKISPGFRFESFDFVIDPSVKHAQITKIMEDLEIPDAKNSEESEDMKTLAELKEEFPELLAEYKTEVLAESQTALDAVKAEKDTLQTRVTELETLKATQEAAIAKHTALIEGFVTALKGGEYVAETKEIISEEATARITAMETSLNDVKAELATTKEALTAKTAELDALNEATNKTLIDAYINEKVSGQQFEAILKTRLTNANLKTKEDVDAALGGYAEFIEALEGQETVLGKGRGKKTEDQTKANGSGDSSLKEKIQRKAGIRPKEAK